MPGRYLKWPQIAETRAAGPKRRGQWFLRQGDRRAATQDLGLPRLVPKEVPLYQVGLLADPAVSVVDFIPTSLRRRLTLVVGSITAVFAADPMLLVQGMRGLFLICVGSFLGKLWQ
jgi:hypothetical protein